MSKSITITDPTTSVKYTLEYSRRSAQMMEAQGFVADEVTKSPMTMLPLLFQGAFLMHHRTLPTATIDELYTRITQKEQLIEALSEMYMDTYMSLVDDPEGPEEKNCTWAMNR